MSTIRRATCQPFCSPNFQNWSQGTRGSNRLGPKRRECFLSRRWTGPTSPFVCQGPSPTPFPRRPPRLKEESRVGSLPEETCLPTPGAPSFVCVSFFAFACLTKAQRKKPRAPARPARAAQGREILHFLQLQAPDKPGAKQGDPGVLSEPASRIRTQRG